MKYFLNVIYLGIILLLGLVSIQLLPEAVFSEQFKLALTLVWVLTYVVGLIVTLMNNEI